MIQKLGRFLVDAHFFDRLTPDEGTNLFHRMIVLRAEQRMDTFRTEYLAYHPDFRNLREGDVIPMYSATFSPDSIYPVWS